jgi:ComEC/Rec2-related protein
MGPSILISLIGLVAGILVATGIPASHRLLFLVPLVVVALALRLWNPVAYRPMLRSLLPVMPAFPVFFLTGWISVTTTFFNPNPMPSVPVAMTGRILDCRELSEKSTRLVVRMTRLSIRDSSSRAAGRIVLMVRPAPGVVFHPGETWWFGPVSIRRITGEPAANGFVPDRYWLSRGIRYEAWIPGGKAGLIRPSGFGSPGQFFARWRDHLSDGIDKMSLSSQSKSLVKAMILGDRSGVEQTTLDNFSKAGIIHVLSVSGLHVGIVYLIVTTILKVIPFIGFRVRTSMALCGVLAYAGLTGFSPSALRASGMILLFGVAGISRRGTSGFAIWGAMALIHCLIDPYALFSAGAQMSYLAVAGILLWNPVIVRLQRNQNRILRYLTVSVGISLAAQCLILPVMLFWFGRIPLYFLAGTVILLPVMIISFYMGLGIVLFHMAGCWLPFAGKALDAMVAFAVGGAERLGNLPGNIFQPKGMEWPDLVMYYFIVLSVRYFIKKPDQAILKRLLAGTILLLAFGALWRMAP